MNLTDQLQTLQTGSHRPGFIPPHTRCLQFSDLILNFSPESTSCCGSLLCYRALKAARGLTQPEITWQGPSGCPRETARQHLISQRPEAHNDLPEEKGEYNQSSLESAFICSPTCFQSLSSWFKIPHVNSAIDLKQSLPL